MIGQKDIVTYKSQYIYSNNNLYNQFTELWTEFINSTIEITECFQNIHSHIVFKKGNSLANILIRASYHSIESQTDLHTTDLDSTVLALADLWLNRGEGIVSTKPRPRAFMTSSFLLPGLCCCPVVHPSVHHVGVTYPDG